MAKSEQQRQKKLAKKRSKELRGHRELARRNQAMNSIAGQMQWASRYPIHSCLVAEDEIGTSGMRSVYFTRKVNDSRYAFMFILVDAHCLGVKDAGCRFCSLSELESFLERGSRSQTFVKRDPSYAKKFVDEAIAYAESLGLSAHPDYRKVAPLWGDVDALQCDEEFTFGLNGKPSFYSGPSDDEARQNFIFRRLCETVGEGNFHFIIGVPSGSGGFSEIEGMLGDGEMNDVDDDDEDFDDGEEGWDAEGRVIEGTDSKPIQHIDSRQ